MSENLHLERFNNKKPGDVIKECGYYWLMVSRSVNSGRIGLSVKLLGNRNISLIRLKAIFYRLKYKKYYKDELL